MKVIKAHAIKTENFLETRKKRKEWQSHLDGGGDQVALDKETCKI